MPQCLQGLLLDLVTFFYLWVTGQKAQWSEHTKKLFSCFNLKSTSNWFPTTVGMAASISEEGKRERAFACLRHWCARGAVPSLPIARCRGWLSFLLLISLSIHERPYFKNLSCFHPCPTYHLNWSMMNSFAEQSNDREFPTTSIEVKVGIYVTKHVEPCTREETKRLWLRTRTCLRKTTKPHGAGSQHGSKTELSKYYN